MFKFLSNRRLVPALVAGVLVIIMASIAGVTKFSYPNDPPPGSGSVVAMREIRFADRADGGVEVTNAADGSVVAELDPQSNNFVRALMRGLVRQRVRQDVGPEVPFKLTAFSDGELTLEDPTTHRSVSLGAFGTSNAEAFVKLLPLQAIHHES
jgi:putative photosynthetic complex assembly protein